LHLTVVEIDFHIVHMEGRISNAKFDLAEVIAQIAKDDGIMVNPIIDPCGGKKLPIGTIDGGRLGAAASDERKG
jgi:hypothetical protein